MRGAYADCTDVSLGDLRPPDRGTDPSHEAQGADALCVLVEDSVLHLFHLHPLRFLAGCDALSGGHPLPVLGGLPLRRGSEPCDTLAHVSSDRPSGRDPDAPTE